MTCPLYILPELGVLFVGQRCRGNQEAAGAALSFVEGRDFGNSGRKKMIERSYLAVQEFYEILVVLFLRQSLCKLKLRVGGGKSLLCLPGLLHGNIVACGLREPAQRAGGPRGHFLMSGVFWRGVVLIVPAGFVSVR